APLTRTYESALAQWRAAWGGAKPQPSCRVEWLGQSLYRAGVRQPPVSAAAWNLTAQWASHMHSLAARQREPSDCQEFARFHENGWLPPIWRWAETTPGLDSEALQDLVEDPEYETYYAQAAGEALPFGSPAVETLWRPQGTFRRKRVQELQHLRILRRAA
ncbi:unnamed protein product, partial [Polarella glacialis]